MSIQLNPEIIREQFAIFGCAQLSDAAPQFVQVLDHLNIAQRVPGKKIAGPAFPVITLNDMLPCLQALQAAPTDSVIFIHNDIAESEALAGDIYVTAALNQGIAGLIVNGAIRDIDSLSEIGLPVYSKTINYVSAKTAKVPAVTVPSIIDKSDYKLQAGDWIFADADGMLSIKAEHVSAVFKSALLLRQREEELKKCLSAGERLDVICGLTDFLEGRSKLKFDV
jgi:4-hydroxy-4-methyl-2-oxoglutarate aldolase